MAKMALCVNKIEDIVALLKEENKTIDTYLVDREICEKPENQFLQIIPYVTFYNVDKENGKLNIIQYIRASKGNEDRLYAKTSIGFGGHIDNLMDISSSECCTLEDGATHFVMNKSELFATIFETANREIKEELGEELLNKLNIKFNIFDTAFFTGDMSEEVNKVHLGVSIPVELPEEQYKLFFDTIKINTEEIDKIDSMVVNLKNIIEEMNIDTVLNSVQNELKVKNNMEDWSLRVFDYITRKVIYNILKDVTYEDLITVSKEKEKNVVAQ